MTHLSVGRAYAGAVRVLVVAIVLLRGAFAFADPAVLGKTPRDEGMHLYSQATKMFEDQDFIAAAVTFGQAAQLLARVDRDATGTVIDADAHSFRNAALSNRATAYSRAQLYVEAAATFRELRDQFAKELADKDRSEIDDAMAQIEQRVGSVVLSGLPTDDDVEVRFDGRFERRPLDKPLAMSEGTHALDITAKGYRPYVAEITVVGQQELAHHVELVPLDTPARLRVESSVGRSSVTIDGASQGTAPIEVTLKPGHHHVSVASESYVDGTSDVVLKPGERSIVHVGMVRARAPLGLRVMPEFFATLPGRTDTPFGKFGQTIALALFHDLLRIRTVRFGIEVAYSPRKLDSVATGVIGTWCPDRTTWTKVTWCPVSFVASYGFGGEDPPFSIGVRAGARCDGAGVSSRCGLRARGHRPHAPGLRARLHIHNGNHEPQVPDAVVGDLRAVGGARPMKRVLAIVVLLASARARADDAEDPRVLFASGRYAAAAEVFEHRWSAKGDANDGVNAVVSWRTAGRTRGPRRCSPACAAASRPRPAMRLPPPRISTSASRH